MKDGYLDEAIGDPPESLEGEQGLLEGLAKLRAWRNTLGMSCLEHLRGLDIGIFEVSDMLSHALNHRWTSDIRSSFRARTGKRSHSP